MGAADNKNIEQCKLLLTLGALPNIKDNKNRETLVRVEKCFSETQSFEDKLKYTRIIQMLIEAHPDYKKR